MKPDVSVIIPVCNGDAYLGEAIESVLRQSFRDFEILVVDDGSDDRSAEIAASYPDVRLLRRPHEGVSAARNCGIMEARADLIAFLDADDLYTEDKLKLQAAYMAAHPDCGIVFSEHVNFTGLAEEQLTKRHRALLQETMRYIFPTACIRREVFAACGLFDTAYPYAEDTEFLMRLSVSGVDLGHRIEKPLYRRRIHENNITLQHEDPGASEMYGILADAVRKRRKKMAAAAAAAPMISVIIPAWNAEKYIGEAIRSVRADAAAKGAQIIVVDDGSGDATAKIAQDLGCQVFRQERGGAASARNLGLAHADGELILFLDADDRLAEGAVGRLLLPFQKNASLCAVLAKAADFISPELGEEEAAGLSPRTAPYDGILPGCALIRRRVFDVIGTFDSSLKTAETVDWMMKLRDCGLPLMKIDSVTAERRLHLNNTGRRERAQELKDYAALLRRRMKARK